MAVRFNEIGHEYLSNEGEPINWTSVTRLVSKFKEPFDAKTQSVRSSKNKKSKWFGVDPEKIQFIWETEAKRSHTLGNFYHNREENTLYEKGFVIVDGQRLPVIKPIIEGTSKIARDQKLTPGCYPEHLVYLKSAGICGQSDRMDVTDEYIHIKDYKSNKEIDRESFVNWEGKHKMMLPPIDHIMDCNFYHYALQLSIYMYIALKHNPKLKPGKMIIEHVKFEKSHDDEWGMPVYSVDENGNFIVKETELFEVPYLKSEVIAMIKAHV